MDLDRLLEYLTDPSLYRHLGDRVEVLRKHLSAVFLAGAGLA